MSLHDIYAGTAVEIRDSSRLDVTMDEINAITLKSIQPILDQYLMDVLFKKSLVNKWNPTGALQVPFVYNEPEH